jgi:5-(carboxyamino)imidazole ribonucleotide synthase
VSANVLGTVDGTRPAELAGVERVLERDGAHLHWYGKDDVRPLRKMGHVTATDEDRRPSADALDDLLESTRELRDGLTFR